MSALTVKASLPGNGERGLKQPTPHGPIASIQASLPGNGERGLKQLFAAQKTVHTPASLPGNGERGLKQRVNRNVSLAHAGFAPRQRGAWIETITDRSM